MLTVFVEAESEVVTGKAKEIYEVGERVALVPLFNNPGHYKDGDKVPGTVIHRFWNGRGITYRVRLDVVWNERSLGQPCGQKIIAGNIGARELLPLVED
jgi:hypothetical protein